MLRIDPPMAFSVVGVVAPVLAEPFSSLSVIVEVDGDREKALKGPRCVSLSSSIHLSAKHARNRQCSAWDREHRDGFRRRQYILLVSFQDMFKGIAVREICREGR